MKFSLSKSFYGVSIPVWQQGESKTKKLERGTYKFTFKNVDMNSSLFHFIKERLPFVTTLQSDEGQHTLKVTRVDYNANTHILEVFLFVTSPPLVYIIGGLGLLGVGAYTLYRVERIFTLPIWSLGAIAFITYMFTKK